MYLRGKFHEKDYRNHWCRIIYNCSNISTLLHLRGIRNNRTEFHIRELDYSNSLIAVFCKPVFSAILPYIFLHEVLNVKCYTDSVLIFF